MALCPCGPLPLSVILIPLPCSWLTLSSLPFRSLVTPRHHLSLFIIQLRRHRDDEGANLFVVHGVLDSIMKMTSHAPSPAAAYTESFEAPCLAETQAYYEAEAQRVFATMDAASCMVHILKRLEDEARRCAGRGLIGACWQWHVERGIGAWVLTVVYMCRDRECLQIISIPKVMQRCEQALIVDNQDRLVAEFKARMFVSSLIFGQSPLVLTSLHQS